MKELKYFIWFYMGYDQNPFTYHFFPTELGVFVLGILAFRAYKKNWAIHHKVIQKTLPLLVCSVVCIHNMLELKDFNELSTVLILIGFSAALPTLFESSKSSKTDRYLCELSYPVYINHTLLIGLSMPIVHTLKFNHYHAEITAILSLLVAAVMVKCIMNPIEKYRQQRLTTH